MKRIPGLTGSERGTKQSTFSGLRKDHMQDGSCTVARKLPASRLMPQVLTERAARARGERNSDKEGRPRVRKDNLWIVRPKEQPGRPSMALVAQVSLEQGSGHLFYRGQKVNISRFEGHIVSVSTIQLCHCGPKATTDNIETNKCDCVHKTFIFENRWRTQFGPWTMVCRPLA